MSISQIIYASKAIVDIDDEQLCAIQSTAVRNNSSQEITGLLLYGRRWFIQLLEGEFNTIDALLEKICKDDRHTDVEILYRGPGEKRLFPTWSMGVISLDHSEVELDIKAIWDQLDVAQAVKDGNPQPFYQLFEMFQRSVTQAPVTA